jgi:hypothetical protein
MKYRSRRILTVCSASVRAAEWDTFFSAGCGAPAKTGMVPTSSTDATMGNMYLFKDMRDGGCIPLFRKIIEKVSEYSI